MSPLGLGVPSDRVRGDVKGDGDRRESSRKNPASPTGSEGEITCISHVTRYVRFARARTGTGTSAKRKMVTCIQLHYRVRVVAKANMLQLAWEEVFVFTITSSV